LFDIHAILQCPKCRCALPENLSCPCCGTQYTHGFGVYNLIHMELSGEQEYLNREELTEEYLAQFLTDEKVSLSTELDDYTSRMNRETLEGFAAQDAYVRKRLHALQGTVCDLATGGGNMLQLVLDEAPADVTIVCTDISNLELAVTRRKRCPARENVYCIATDGRYLAVQDSSFDWITSFAGFGNIPDTEKVASELYRVLKPGGRLLIKGSYIEKDSRSYALAESVGIARGMVEEYLLQDLRDAGFAKVQSTVVAEAVWAENPYDLIPAAGDLQRFCVIEAVK